MKFLDESDGQSFDTKDFVRLKDGEEVSGVCAGEVFKFKQHWNGQRSEVCTQDNLCTHCAQGAKAQFRFRVNFIVKEGSGYLAKILEQGWNLLEELDFLNTESGGHLEKHVIKISRKGKTMNDTKYRVKDMGALPVEKLEVIAKIDLHDLSLKEKDQKPEVFASEPKFDAEEELPF
jgi:hypothetical protein